MDSRKKTRPNEIRITPAKNKGFIVRHSYDNSMSGPSYQPPDEFAFGDHKGMLAHVTKHTIPDAANDAGATEGSGPAPQVATSPDVGATRPTGVSGKAKARPPNARTRGAGMD